MQIESSQGKLLHRSTIHTSQRCVVERVVWELEGTTHKTVTKRYFRRALRRQAMKTGMSDTEIVKAEFDAMRTVLHSGIVKALSVVESNTAIELSMVDAGDALAIKRYPILSIKTWMVALSSALCALHDCSIVHMDVKPDNIFLSENGVRLGDFGSAMVIPSHGKVSKFPKITPAFSAPELCLMSMNAAAVSTVVEARPLDMWSLGVTLYVLLFGTMPFKCGPDIDLTTCYMSIVEDDPKFDEVFASGEGDVEVPDQMLEALRGLLQKDPKKRLTAHALHDLMKNE